MHFNGNFESSFLASILQLLCGEKKTGVLRFFNDEKDVKIYIHNGAVIYAIGSPKEARLGHLLKNKGLISAKQLQNCLMIAKESKKSLGKVLVEKGFISLNTLKKFIHIQAEEVIFDLFLWQKGHFEYKDAKLNLKNVEVLQIDIMAIILEATRRIDEMSVLKKEIPNDTTVFKISEKAPDKEEIKLNPTEWRLFSLIKDKQSVRDLIHKSGYDDFTIYKVLFSLVSFGLIERYESTDEHQDEANPTIIQLYTDILYVIHHHLETELQKRPFTIIHPLQEKPSKTFKNHIKAMRKKEILKWINSIFRECQPKHFSQQVDIFQNFCAEYTATANIEEILNIARSFYNSSKDKQPIIVLINDFIGNLFDRILTTTGCEATQTALEKVEKILSHYPDTLTGTDNLPMIINGLQNILTPIKQQIVEQGTEKMPLKGILAISL